LAPCKHFYLSLILILILLFGVRWAPSVEQLSFEMFSLFKHSSLLRQSANKVQNNFIPSTTVVKVITRIDCTLYCYIFSVIFFCSQVLASNLRSEQKLCALTAMQSTLASALYLCSVEFDVCLQRTLTLCLNFFPIKNGFNINFNAAFTLAKFCYKHFGIMYLTWPLGHGNNELKHSCLLVYCPRSQGKCRTWMSMLLCL